MAGNPKENGDKIAAVLKAWTDLCPTKSFGGMTLAQFTAKVQPSIDARATIDTLNNQLTSAADNRDDADIESMKQVTFVVNGVKSDPDLGEDSDVYEAMGYVRKSERASGKTNKSKPAPATPSK